MKQFSGWIVYTRSGSIYFYWWTNPVDDGMYTFADDWYGVDMQTYVACEHRLNGRDGISYMVEFDGGEAMLDRIIDTMPESFDLTSRFDTDSIFTEEY